MMRMRTGLLIGLTGLVIWAGCSNPNLAGGKLHFDQKRYDRALETFKLARQQMPASGEARLWVGRAFAEIERADSTTTSTAGADSASANFDRALALDPRLEKQVADVRGHYWSERFASGVTAARAAQDNVDQGDKGAAQREYRSSLNYFKKALVYSTEKDKKQTYENLGKMYFNLNQVDSALAIFNLVRSMAPDDPMTKGILFDVYFNQGQKCYQDAADALQHSDSTKARAGFKQALSLYAKSSEVVSEEKQQQSDLLFQQGAAAYELAYLEKAEKNDYLGKAAEGYEGVLKLTPDDIDVLYNLALVYRDKADYQKARDVARRLLDLKPTEGQYHDLVGRMEDKLGNKNALIAGLIFGKALKQGSTVAPTEARARSEKFGPSSDIARRFRENGQPEDLRVFPDQNGKEYECWFYWARGTAFAFVDGSQKYDTKFAGQKK